MFGSYINIKYHPKHVVSRSTLFLGAHGGNGYRDRWRESICLTKCDMTVRILVYANKAFPGLVTSDSTSAGCAYASHECSFSGCYIMVQLGDPVVKINYIADISYGAESKSK